MVHGVFRGVPENHCQWLDFVSSLMGLHYHYERLERVLFVVGDSP